MNETKDALQPAKGNDQAATPDQHSMEVLFADDLTANLEVFTKIPGQKEVNLFTPQVVAVMDGPSGKYVGWAISDAHETISALAAAPAESPLSARGAAIRSKMAAGFSREQAMEITNRQRAK